MPGSILRIGQNAFACSGVSHSLAMPASRLAWMWRLNACSSWMVVREQHDAARREHHVVVELLRQRRPQLVGVAVDRLGASQR